MILLMYVVLLSVDGGYDLVAQSPIDLIKYARSAFFDDGLSANDRQSLQKLSINETHTINNYGNLDSLQAEITNFLILLGNNQEDSLVAAEIIYKMVERDIAVCHAQTGWIALRAFTPNDAYDLPRLHTDGIVFLSSEGGCYKIVYVFQADSTLFVEIPEAMRAEFYQTQSSRFAEMTPLSKGGLFLKQKRMQ